MSPILPAALREAASRFVENVPAAEIARRTARLSETYRSGADAARAIADAADVAAYLTARLPATYAAFSAVLTRVAEHAPGFAPQSVLDVGAGPGTASWAAAGIWPGVERIVMLDRNPHLLAAAGILALESGSRALREARRIAGDMTAPSVDTYDAVLAGYAIAELPAAALKRAVDALWRACRGVLVIVEPGTPAGFARILQCRETLLAQGAHLIAPCPGAYSCPIQAPDWCHFSVRLPRSRAHMRAKSANVPFEDERFSYLAVARDTVPVSRSPSRIIAEPKTAKPGVTLRLCADGTVEERVVPRRDAAAYKRAAKTGWGDSFP